MKYNKSEIMRKAWELFREGTVEMSFSLCLKTAWRLAKKTVKKVAEVKKNIVFTDIKQWFLNKMDSVSFMALESGIAVNDIVLERETEKAIQISTEWNGYRKMIWFPKSVVSYK